MAPHTRSGCRNRRYRAFGTEPLESRVLLSIAAVSLRVDGTDTGNVAATFSQQSADGRYVVFRSSATNLVSGINDVNGFNSDIFRRDRLTGKTELVSVSRLAPNRTPNQSSSNAYISANGRFVVFESNASDLVANDTNADFFNPGRDVFVRTGGSFLPKISADGNVIVFESFRRLSTADANNANRDVYVRDMQKTKPDLVSISSTGGPANSASFDPNISDDGRFVVFESLAVNLTTTDKDPSTIPDLTDLDNKDVFRRDLSTGRTELVSFNFQNTRSALGESRKIAVSGNGRIVSWESQSLNLTASHSSCWMICLARSMKTSLVTCNRADYCSVFVVFATMHITQHAESCPFFALLLIHPPACPDI